MNKYLIIMLVMAVCSNCSSKNKQDQKSKDMTTDTLANRGIVIEESMLEPMRIVFIRDTIPLAGLRQFFSTSYEELYSFATKHDLVAGKAMAFYDNYNDPINVEAAIEVSSIPNHIPGRILTRIVERGSVVVAHYMGSYEKMGEPYSQLAEWIKDHNKEPRGLPFEVYINNPAMVKDSSGLRTDIYQLIK